MGKEKEKANAAATHSLGSIGMNYELRIRSARVERLRLTEPVFHTAVLDEVEGVQIIIGCQVRCQSRHR